MPKSNALQCIESLTKSLNQAHIRIQELEKGLVKIRKNTYHDDIVRPLIDELIPRPSFRSKPKETK